MKLDLSKTKEIKDTPLTSSIFVGLAAFFSVLAVACTYVAGQLKNSEDLKQQTELSNKVYEIAQLEQEKGKLQVKLTNLIENDLKPHIVYAAVEYTDHKLKVVFNNTGDRILRNPTIKYKVKTIATLKGKVISNQTSEDEYIHQQNIDDPNKNIQFGWKPGANWEVYFPVRINENVPPFETVTFTFSFSMTVAGFTAGANDEHSNFSRIFVFIDQVNPEKNMIKNESSTLQFKRVE